MKWLKFLYIAVSAVVLASCTNVNEDKQIDNIILPTDYSYDQIQNFKLTLETMFEVDNDAYYTYFYSSTCSHCQELKNFIIEKALERKDIYFIKSSSKDKFTTDENLVINAGNPDDIYILGYPTMLKIENKIVTKNLPGNDKIIEELK